MVGNLVRHQRGHSSIRPRVVTLNRQFRSSGELLPRHADIDGVPVKRIGYCGSERYPMCPQVLAAIREADIVHVHGIDFFFDYLALTRPLHRKVLVASTHGGFFHTQFARRLKELYFTTATRFSARGYRQVVATSFADGDAFARILAPERLRVIENGVDIEKFAGASSATLRPAMIYFGRWASNKGILQAMRLFATIRARAGAPRWQLTIAGRPYDLSESDLQQEALTLGIAVDVRIVADPDTEALRSLIGEASYFICLSRHEGFGLAAVEALSAGLVPILSDIPPFRRLLAGAQIGVLVRSASPSNDESASAVLEMHDGARYVRLRRLAQEYAGAYSWDAVAASYTQVYESIGAGA